MSNSATPDLPRLPDARQKGIQALSADSGTPIRMLDGSGVTTQAEVLGEATSTLGFTMPSLQEQLIQGGYFDFSYSDPNAGLWGMVGLGPDGAHWDRNGSPTANPYVPGTYQVSDIDARAPVLFRGAEPISPESFRRRYLAGLDAAFAFLGPDYEATFRYWWRVALGELEARLGQIIWPRIILTDGQERGFRPGVDFDIEEREYDFSAREFYCQPAGTPVLTWYGMKPIEEVREGDLVLTHTGAWSPVVASGSRPYHGTMIGLHIAGNPEPVWMTENHRVWAHHDPLYVQRKFHVRETRQITEGAFTEAKDLRVGDVVSWPVDMTVLSEREIKAHFTEACGEDAVYESDIATRDPETGRIVAAKRIHRPVMPDEVGFAMDPDFWRLVGYWLGDGTILPHGIVLTVGAHKEAIAEDIQQIAERLLHRTAVTALDEKSHVWRIQIQVSPLRRFFDGLYHRPDGARRHASQKRMYPWMERLPLDCQRELLKGYFLTDGSVDRNGRSEDYRIGSTSLELLSAVRRIGWRLGVAGSLSGPTHPSHGFSYKGKTYAARPTYHFRAGQDFARAVLGEDLPDLRPSAKKLWVKDGRVYAQITKIERREDADETVYSFTTAHPDHSYVGDGIATHNSWGWMTLRYKPVMQILQLNLVYPTGQEILAFPGSWIKPQMLSGQIRLVPPQGALSQITLGPGGYLVMLLGGMFLDMPGLLFADYVAGMWPIPDLLIHAISMRAAIHLFQLASDALQQGMMQTEASFEGDVNERRVFTTRPEAAAFESRIQRYEKEIDRVVGEWLQFTGGMPQISVI